MGSKYIISVILILKSTENSTECNIHSGKREAMNTCVFVYMFVFALIQRKKGKGGEETFYKDGKSRLIIIKYRLRLCEECF